MTVQVYLLYPWKNPFARTAEPSLIKTAAIPRIIPNIAAKEGDVLAPFHV